MSDSEPTADTPDVDVLVQRYAPVLRAFVRQRMGCELRAREESRDIVQSVTREVLTHRERFRHGGERGFREWLLTTAQRKISNRVDRWRTGKRNGEETPMPSQFADGAPTPSMCASAREDGAALERALAALSHEQRDVILWSRLHGMGHAAIAERLGKTEVAVRKILSRALAALAARLAGVHGDVTGDRR